MSYRRRGATPLGRRLLTYRITCRLLYGIQDTVFPGISCTVRNTSVCRSPLQCCCYIQQAHFNLFHEAALTNNKLQFLILTCVINPFSRS